MAAITITVPDPVVNRVLDAVAAMNHYNAATDGTKAAFAKALIAKWIKGQVSTYESQLAAESARQAAQTSVETGISIT